MRRPYAVLPVLLSFVSCARAPETTLEAPLDQVHTFWLILLSGFSSAILFFIWKNLAGQGPLNPGRLFRIVTQQIGDEKNDLGILTLSLAILCWFISGLISLIPYSFPTLLATSICSSLNSCFLLLFLRHLDKEDLPSGFRAYFPSRHTIWTVFIILFLATLAIAGPVYTSAIPGYTLLLPDLAFSLYTLYFIGLSFFYLLTARMKTMEMGILSFVPILITLLAEICRLVSFTSASPLNSELSLINQTLLFTYKPLLIISYFVLIYSWQLKRINQSDGLAPKNATPKTPEPSADVLANRAHYRSLGEKDWLILELLARGEKATAIAQAHPQSFPNGAKGVDDRVSALAREFQLSGQSQIKIVVAGLKRGLLKLEDIP